jgi:uncharacterized membrane protein
MIYQGAVLLVSIVLVLFWGVCLALSLLPAAIRPDLYRSSPPSLFWFALAGLVVPVGFGILAALYGLYGAYQAYRGRSFRYPLAGRLARGLSRPPATSPAAPAPPASQTAPEAAAGPAPAETAPDDAPHDQP